MSKGKHMLCAAMGAGLLAAACTAWAGPAEARARLCAEAKKYVNEEFMYSCADGSVREDNNCSDGSFGHLFNPKSITCKQHDAKRPNRIAVAEFIGAWKLSVPGGVDVVDDYANDVRTTHIRHGSGVLNTLVINPNGTYEWKGVRGSWRETADDENPIRLYRGPDGHDWDVSILENWYGFLAVSEANNPGNYYHGQR